MNFFDVSPTSGDSGSEAGMTETCVFWSHPSSGDPFYLHRRFFNRFQNISTAIADRRNPQRTEGTQTGRNDSGRVFHRCDKNNAQRKKAYLNPKIQICLFVLSLITFSSCGLLSFFRLESVLASLPALASAPSRMRAPHCQSL